MQILEIRTLEGPNVHSHQPVMVMRLDVGTLDAQPTCAMGDFNARLCELLPGLAEHYCSRGKPGGFLERLQEGTYLPHVLEHVIIELQCMAGSEVNYGKARLSDTEGIYEIITEYRIKEAVVRAAQISVEIIEALLAGQDYALETALEQIKQLVASRGLGPSTMAIVEAAKKRGIPVMRLGEGSLLQLGYGKNQRRIQATITQHTRCIAVDIACDKVLTKQLLDDAGIPVPRGGVVGNEEEAVALTRELGVPVVVKPRDGNQGKGVTLNLHTDEEVRFAFRLAQNYGEKVMVEEYIKGHQYRLAVVGERVVAASERIPTFVVGDGEHTIKELIDITNLDPRRGEEHEKPLTKIKIDPVVYITLAKQNLNLESIPAKGEQVILRANANLSTGGVAVDVTDLVHPANAFLAVRAAQAVGLDVAGVDIVAEDIAKPITGGSGAVIEVNAAPGIRMHHYPFKGQPRDVAGAIVEHLFPPGSEARIPIISITGTNGKTTTTRLIGHILKGAGIYVGMTTTDGIYLDGHCIIEGDTTGPESAKVVLKDPKVEVAVLETARGGILKGGLGYDHNDIAVVTNITNDHLGQYGVQGLEDLAHVKSLVVETLRDDGYAVLNADDPFVAGMSTRTRAKVVYFSMQSDNLVIKRHLGEGGKAIFVRNRAIVIADGKQESTLLAIEDVPLCWGGKAIHNVQNTLAALAAVYVMGVNLRDILHGLRTFLPDAKCNPGRLNLLEVNDFKVLIDYGHNAAGYEAILYTARQLKPARLIGVIGVPGDRTDETIIGVGKIAGRGFDHIIIKEDDDLRGRKPGEVAELLLKGIRECGKSAVNPQIILQEAEAVKLAMQVAQPNDLVVIFYEKFPKVLKTVETVKPQLVRNKNQSNKLLQGITG